MIVYICKFFRSIGLMLAPGVQCLSGQGFANSFSQHQFPPGVRAEFRLQHLTIRSAPESRRMYGEWAVGGGRDSLWPAQWGRSTVKISSESLTCAALDTCQCCLRVGDQTRHTRPLSWSRS